MKGEYQWFSREKHIRDCWNGNRTMLTGMQLVGAVVIMAAVTVLALKEES